jgi:hypothetical protein
LHVVWRAHDRPWYFYLNLIGNSALRVGPVIGHCAAGSEAADRRARLRSVIGFAVDYYRSQLKRMAQTRPHNAAATPPASSSPLPALEACLSAGELVDRNVNLALIVAQWLAALAGQARHFSHSLS